MIFDCPLYRPQVLLGVIQNPEQVKCENCPQRVVEFRQSRNPTSSKTPLCDVPLSAYLSIYESTRSGAVRKRLSSVSAPFVPGVVTTVFGKSISQPTRPVVAIIQNAIISLLGCIAIRKLCNILGNSKLSRILPAWFSPFILIPFKQLRLTCNTLRINAAILRLYYWPVSPACQSFSALSRSTRRSLLLPFLR